ncbi:MAG TPA: diaminobutyrate--2-oxoglutarate transaminase [Gammaproteobacteria bacterium]|nr:diaminobutyrate--2-oxoglutarate transaminase [Gammaproteobacteria bacterium]
MDIFERLESNVRGYCRLYPTVFDTALNARQWDVDGREYIDFFAGAGVLNYGHNNEKMRQAMVDYLMANGVCHSLDMASRTKAQFMQAFEDIILKPRKLDYKLQFTGPTGTNSVEAALKLARKVTGRRTVAAFTNGFHGMTLGALDCTANSMYRNASGVPLNNVERVPFEGYLDNSEDTLDALRNALTDSSSGVEPPAAFIVETIQAEGGVNVASAEWLQKVQALAHEHGALFIIDDIQVACGRTGAFFSFEELGLSPDLVCLAKGIGGYGTPLAMVLIKPEYDQWKPGEHSGTFRGQNLSFVAGTQALNYYKNDKFMASVTAKGQHMQGKLNAMIPNHFSIRGRGMIFGIDTGSGETASAILKKAFENGLLVAKCGTDGRVVKMTPPLTIEDDTLDKGLDILANSLL